MEAILGAILSVLGFIWDGIKKAFESVLSVLSSVWDRIIDIKEAITGAVKYSIRWVKRLITDTVDFFVWLYDLIIDFFPWFWSFLKELFTALMNLLKDFMSWIFEEFLDLIISLLSSIPGVEKLQELSQYYSGLPGEVLSMMGLIGIPEATGIIVTAILVRLFLQLIPFTRLGS